MNVLEMNARQKAAYDVGSYEYHNYGKMANWEDFSIYIGHPDDYDFYVDGYQDARTEDNLRCEKL